MMASEWEYGDGCGTDFWRDSRYARVNPFLRTAKKSPVKDFTTTKRRENIINLINSSRVSTLLLPTAETLKNPPLNFSTNKSLWYTSHVRTITELSFLHQSCPCLRLFCYAITHVIHNATLNPHLSHNFIPALHAQAIAVQTQLPI